MSDTTLEEAKRCPKCSELGKANGIRPMEERYMGKLHIFMCVNERCSWNSTTWSVQVRPDGTIPQPTMNREKNYPTLEGPTKERIAKTRANIDAQINDSMGR